MSGDAGEACVGRQSPATKLVYKALEYEGAQTQSELVAWTCLSRDGVRRALQSLDDCAVVDWRYDVSDPRRKCYRLLDE